MMRDDDNQVPKKPAPDLTEPADAKVKSTLRRIAHELRTPIGAIASSADLMRSEAFGPLGDERYLDYAKSIGESAEFALSVVEQSIDDLGIKADIVLEAVDANAVICDSIAQLKPLADDAGVSLDAERSQGSLMVVSDAVKLQQIINNLGANAIKFSPIGSRVTVSSHFLDDTSAMISVSDNGLGMGDAELARVRNRTAGPSLGYSTIHDLIERSGAVLVIESTRGSGTRVDIQLKLAEQKS